MSSNAIDLGKMQRNVLLVIRETPEAADDDSLLISKYWRKFCGWSDNRSLEENISLATRPESITRRRRELHEKGLIFYSDESQEMREEAFVNERDHASDFVSPIPKNAEDCRD